MSIYRLITGLGIGAAMPNCITLASEFVPANRRALLLNLSFAGFRLEHLPQDSLPHGSFNATAGALSF